MGKREQQFKFHNEHEFVDSGLSVKWATCNLGASYPEEIGSYYSWPEQNSKRCYDIKSCETWKYRIDDISSNPKRDASRIHWGQ